MLAGEAQVRKSCSVGNWGRPQGWATIAPISSAPIHDSAWATILGCGIGLVLKHIRAMGTALQLRLPPARIRLAIGRSNATPYDRVGRIAASIASRRR